MPRACLTLVDRGGRLLGRAEARADGSREPAVPGAEPHVLPAGATEHVPGMTDLDLTARLLPGETVLLLREVTTARGRVTGDSLRMPVPGAPTVLMDERGSVAGSTVTADDGFDVAGLRPGGYTLLILHQKYEHWLRPVFVGGGDPFLADATLTRRLFSCRGVVRDAPAGPPRECSSAWGASVLWRRRPRSPFRPRRRGRAWGSTGWAPQLRGSSGRNVTCGAPVRGWVATSAATP